MPDPLEQRIRAAAEYIHQEFICDVDCFNAKSCGRTVANLETALILRLRPLYDEQQAELERLREALEQEPERWSFKVLLLVGDALLEKLYPEDVFTGESGDAGARLVVALRECRAALEKR